VPDGIDQETYYAAFPVEVTLDGDLSEWSNLPFQSITTGPIIPTDPAAQSSAEFAAVADFDYLYVAVRVDDQHVIANEHGVEYWREDSVEIYVNATGNPELSAYTEGVAQISVPAANIGLRPGESIIIGINSEAIGARATAASKDNGYVIEVAIPLVTPAWTITPEQDGSIGFQVQLNGSSETDRDLKLSWSNADQTDDRSYFDPSVFGQLVFFQTSTERPTAPELQANFEVDGPTIIDPNGEEFVPKGVNVSGYQWVWQRPTVSDLDLIVDCWNFNTVRVNSFLFEGQVPYAQFDVNNNLDEMVDAFTSQGVVVIFEGHDRIGSYYAGEDLDTLVNWFTDLARRYRDNPYVWFDVMNEPGSRRGIESEQWINMHGRVIEGIRNIAGSDNIIIVEGAYGGQDNPSDNASPVTESAILWHSSDILNYNGQTYDNIMFSIHTYDLWNQGDDKLGDFFDQVHAQGLAILVGEYGVFTDQDTQAAAESTFNTTIPRNIGRIVWHWDGSDNNDLTTDGGGWQINDCQNPSNLTWLGQEIWNDNHTP